MCKIRRRHGSTEEYDDNAVLVADDRRIPLVGTPLVGGDVMCRASNYRSTAIYTNASSDIR